jgi:hypothetical protein
VEWNRVQILEAEVNPLDRPHSVRGLNSSYCGSKHTDQDATNRLTEATTNHNQPSVEAIEEFTLQTNNFAAEFVQVNGGLFNFTGEIGYEPVSQLALRLLRQRRSERRTALSPIAATAIWCGRQTRRTILAEPSAAP